MARRRSNADLHIRLPFQELRSWKAAARRGNESLTDWLRKLGNAAVVPPPPAVPPVVSGDQIELPLVGRRRAS